MHRRITGRLVIATHNPGKLAEMRELLAPHGVEAVSAGELGLDEPEETGATFRANAAIKAISAAKAAGLPAFADDSGLVVDALDGAPGLYSARWAGANKDFMTAMTRVERLLQERGATTPDKRKAHSCRRCVSPGPMIISNRSRRASMELWSGRRAARKVSVTTPHSCPTDT